MSNFLLVITNTYVDQKVHEIKPVYFSIRMTEMDSETKKCFETYSIAEYSGACVCALPNECVDTNEDGHDICPLTWTIKRTKQYVKDEIKEHADEFFLKRVIETYQEFIMNPPISGQNITNVFSVCLESEISII